MMSIWVHPWKFTWNLKIAQLKRKIIWTIHLHDFGFKILIFQGVFALQKKFTKLKFLLGCPDEDENQSVKWWTNNNANLRWKKLTVRHGFLSQMCTYRAKNKHTPKVEQLEPQKHDSWKTILSFWNGRFSEASCWTSREYILRRNIPGTPWWPLSWLERTVSGTAKQP